MPTGYTAKITEGQNFRDFVLGCTKAFISYDGIDLTEADTNYAQERLDEALMERAKWLPLNTIQKKKLWVKYQEEAMDAYDKAYEDWVTEERAYILMKDQILDWGVPSPDHQEFVDFMLQQINISRNDPPRKPKLLSYEDWENNKNEDIARDVRYLAKKIQEIKNQAETNKTWLEKIVNALPQS